MQGYGNKHLIICFHKSKHSSIYNIIVRRKRTDSNSALDSLGHLTVNKTKNVSYLYLNTKKFKKYLYKGITLTLAVAKVLGIDISLLNYTQKKIKNENKIINANYDLKNIKHK